MLIAIDVGNSETVFGFFKKKRIMHRIRLATRVEYTVDEWGLLLFNFMKKENIKKQEVKNGIIASVVPGITTVMAEMIKKNIGIEADVVNASLNLGISIHYQNPSEVGADRLANAIAVRELYDVPAIVVDLGTATTFDVISSRGDYLGGIIAPGVETGLFGLAHKTALLPNVELIVPTSVVGQNTKESMQSGIIFGTLDLIQGIIRRIKREHKGNYTVIVTGGYAELFRGQLAKESIIDRDLTLQGLRIISERIEK